MWLIFVILYIILAVAFTQFYKVVLKTSKSDGSLTVLLQLIAGLTAAILSVFF